MTEKRDENEITLKQEDLEYKIEIATQTLERNISFVSNCDNKTSIVLATFGVLLTIILTNEGVNKIFNIVKICLEEQSLCNIFYLICCTGAIFVMLWGMFKLGKVLIAKTSEEAIGRRDEKSRIFFEGIRKNSNYSSYYQKFCTMSKEELLNELIEQIYINADIASNKYAVFNQGFRYTVIGFVCFVVLLFVGICVY